MFDVEKIHPEPGDVIIAKVDIGQYDLDTVNRFCLEIKKILPDNSVLILPKDIPLEVMDKVHAADYILEFLQTILTPIEYRATLDFALTKAKKNAKNLH